MQRKRHNPKCEFQEMDKYIYVKAELNKTQEKDKVG